MKATEYVYHFPRIYNTARMFHIWLKLMHTSPDSNILYLNFIRYCIWQKKYMVIPGGAGNGLML